MPGRGPQTFKKRQKEQQRKEKQQEKMAKRLARKDGTLPASTDDEIDENPEFPSPEAEPETPTPETSPDVR